MHEMKLKEQAHQLEIQKLNLDHQHKMEELRLKYHQVASNEKVENAKLGETPERQDQFKTIVGGLMEAIQRKRGLPKPPENAA